MRNDGVNKGFLVRLLNERLWRLPVGLLAAGGVALLLYFGTRDTVALIPAELGDLRRTGEVRGDAAREMIDRLHGGVVTPQENIIGFYEGTGARATLYVSVYPDAGDAYAVDSTMERRIQKGNPVFRFLRKVSVEGHALSECTGMGQVHYFFSRRNRLYWLGVDSSVAEHAVEGLVSACDL